MITIEQHHIDQLNEQGWTTVSANLDENRLRTLQTVANWIQTKVSDTDTFPFRRIYHDYWRINNIAGIEIPFNDAICPSEFRDLFTDLRLGAAVCELRGWENTINTLTRIHCSNGYNYMGKWHKDGGAYGKTLQAAVYLRDERGFRLTRPDEMEKVEQEQFGRIDGWEDFTFPVELPKTCYTEVGGKAGEVLFFDPNLVHQGVEVKPRFHFHMRFESLAGHPGQSFKQNPFQDFFVAEELFHTTIPEQTAGIIPQQNQKPFLRRIATSLGYYLPLKPIWQRVTDPKPSNSPLRRAILANTIWQ